MRGMYWMEMPAYQSKNELNNQGKLPGFYWTGNTKMNCLKHCITQSLEDAYAHHIQRLMITGNYALLTQTHPDEVDQWYLGIYIDATYISSGSYINKMSNYCKGCHYKVSKKTEEEACPFNALYWNFLDDKRAHFAKNQRMTMMLSLLDKMDKAKLEKLKQRALHIIQNPDEY